MAKICELFNFERIREVVDIDAITDKKAMVENYVISPSLEEYLVHLFQDLNSSTHKAAQIIGGYGSGKSHLLAFIISLLTEPGLVRSVQNEQVRRAVEAMKRDFVVVHWELQPNDVSLSEYFYDQLEIQLKEKYGISINLPTSGVIDHKKTILQILEKVKEGHPTRGLVVVIDEISDFLKQKTKEKLNQDVQFLRVLGQAAQSCDFMFIGAMQEHIFTNPKYVDEAESFGRVAERFQVITIKREDIKRVIARRVLKKTAEQRLRLEELFREYVHYFPHLQAGLDEYIDLFPLHPYVIQVFSELPYFEKRGVIQFTIQEVEQILDRDFPFLITYDRIYDEIASKHTVKNLETVSPVVNAIQTLESKVDLLEPRHQDTARKIIKALAVLRLYGKSVNNGATAEELANTLLLLPGNRLMEAADEISLVLKNFRRVTDGQFINVTSDGYYFLDLNLTIDYDQVIRRRAENLPEDSLDEEILSILKEQLLLEEGAARYAFRDTCEWSGRRSFREGTFVYETGKGEVVRADGDYRIVFVSPFCAGNRYPPAENCAVISGSLPPEAIEQLKLAVAAHLLFRENYQRSIMEKKYASLKKKFVEMFVQAWLETGQVNIGKAQKGIKALIVREFSNFDELFTEIKPQLFEDYFNQKYPKHPKFTQRITRDNIMGEFGAAIKELLSKGNVQSVFSSTKSILNALDLLDAQGNLSTANSEIAAAILETARAAGGKVVAVEDFINRFRQTPYGYDRWMTAFVIIVLTYNGEIVLRAAGGTLISSSEVYDTFGSGLEAFENIKYLAIESDFNPQPVINLMLALGIDPGITAKMRVTAKRNEALQAFRTRYLEIKEQLDFVRKKLETLALNAGNIVDVNGLRNYHQKLADIPIDKFEQVKAPNDFKKVVYDEAAIQKIGEAYKILQDLDHFYKMYSERLEKEVEYAREVRKVVEEYPGLFLTDGLKEFLHEAFAVLADSSRLVNRSELLSLLGKLQQARQKYVTAYYRAHEKCVGERAGWNKLQELTASQTWKNLLLLKNVTVLNKYPLARVENEISVLATQRCEGFKVELIEKSPLCPRCNFPKSFRGENIGQWIANLEDELEDIFREWEETILAEVKNYQDNLDYLEAGERELILQVMKAGKLPPVVTEDLVVALNNLFRELVSVEVSPAELLEAVFAGARVMDYFTFERRLNAWKQKLVAGHDLDKVRIKLAGGEA
ncbi:hypothetical protein MTHERMOG20_16810 [Moorella thermoacetica]|uniref:AAA+ ATPase domain-containing protein n=1 Tax=Moorella thermoacetica (strain ATCC 39073 / JCM 9320) TaxID=264732 RepID=Q2RKS3_MOOTA|nr:DUF6079 family protein [Moorella thermoacetica]AKX96034.1 hypothetical protein MOTHA_c06770 [Moorella thermoacetica]OIQ56120.1 hypothetical protein MOCA_18230 [Moorella thermoacetica]QCZ99844.1 hypothetical protein MothHH_00691 [Moorella thermoacetica]TYL08612.1 hypothetical protein MOOCA_18400 [Moorella thermoacetica]TYL15262.1 hypothetical protein MOCE_18290 [Moorella thermoacetica]